jgi:nanoRNase/pAp phosphatase (c-di-AMP/oligoRNAs hydrolase)
MNAYTMVLDAEHHTVLDRFFDEFKRGDTFLILTHDNPDPDSLSSAAALAEIAQVIGNAKTTIAYGGIIGRAENAHMVKYLKLKVKPLDQIDFDQYSKVALLDTQPRTGNNSLPKRRIPDLVIDHHPMTRPTKAVPFAEIRTEYGATATILSEYLQYFGLEVPKNLATALLYGIKSETQDLAREAYQVDIDQYIRLLPMANHRLLSKIIHSRVPQSYFRWLMHAIQNAQLVGNVVITRVGDVDNPDMIPEIADLMLRMKGAAWALCQGDYKGAIYLSIRTTNTRKNAGVLMKRLMKGKGAGGGHGLIAGGKVPVQGYEPWQIHELESEIEDQFLRLIRKADKSRVPLLTDEGEKKKKVGALVAVK